MTQCELIPTDRPTLQEVSGTELEPTLRKLRAQGAWPWRLERVGVSGYRVWIHWPAIAPRSTEPGQQDDGPSRVKSVANARHGQGTAQHDTKGIFSPDGARPVAKHSTPSAAATENRNQT